MEETEVEVQIVEAILHNLHGRKGVGDELDWVQSADPETYDELFTDLVDVTETVMKRCG